LTLDVYAFNSLTLGAHKKHVRPITRTSGQSVGSACTMFTHVNNPPVTIFF